MQQYFLLIFFFCMSSGKCVNFGGTILLYMLAMAWKVYLNLQPSAELDLQSGRPGLMTGYLVWRLLTPWPFLGWTPTVKCPIRTVIKRPKNDQGWEPSIGERPGARYPCPPPITPGLAIFNFELYRNKTVNDPCKTHNIFKMLFSRNASLAATKVTSRIIMLSQFSARRCTH